MFNLGTKSINKPETIKIVTNERTQRPDTRSNNQYYLEDVVKDLDEYYQLFQQKRLICEARECNLIAIKELKIPIGIYGEEVFFFCENCVNKFRGEEQK